MTALLRNGASPSPPNSAGRRERKRKRRERAGFLLTPSARRVSGPRRLPIVPSPQFFLPSLHLHFCAFCTPRPLNSARHGGEGPWRQDVTKSSAWPSRFKSVRFTEGDIVWAPKEGHYTTDRHAPQASDKSKGSLCRKAAKWKWWCERRARVGSQSDGVRRT